MARSSEDWSGDVVTSGKCLAVLCAVAGLAIGGCGGMGDPADTVEDLVGAMQEGDLKKACSLMAGDAESSTIPALGLGEADPDDDLCAQGLKATLAQSASELPSLRRSEDVDVAGDEQTARVATEGGIWRLSEFDGKWLVNAPMPLTIPTASNDEPDDRKLSVIEEVRKAAPDLADQIETAVVEENADDGSGALVVKISQSADEATALESLRESCAALGDAATEATEVEVTNLIADAEAGRLNLCDPTDVL